MQKSESCIVLYTYIFIQNRRDFFFLILDAQLYYLHIITEIQNVGLISLFFLDILYYAHATILQRSFITIENY